MLIWKTPCLLFWKPKNRLATIALFKMLFHVVGLLHIPYITSCFCSESTGQTIHLLLRHHKVVKANLNKTWQLNRSGNLAWNRNMVMPKLFLRVYFSRGWWLYGQQHLISIMCLALRILNRKILQGKPLPMNNLHIKSKRFSHVTLVLRNGYNKLYTSPLSKIWNRVS